MDFNLTPKEIEVMFEQRNLVIFQAKQAKLGTWTCGKKNRPL
jgi:hypothetical protein